MTKAKEKTPEQLLEENKSLKKKVKEQNAEIAKLKDIPATSTKAVQH